METKTNNMKNENAFPFTEKQYNKDMGSYEVTNPGMSKRFYAACAAMQGFLSDSDQVVAFHKASEDRGDEEPDLLIETCYKLADELLKQEES